VRKYREEKGKQGRLESFISEKRRNIEKMMQEQPLIEPEQELDLEKFANDIDLKHRRYLEDMSALEDTRLAIIEARGNLEGLQLEITLQEETLASLKKTCTREVGSQEEMAEQLRSRLEG
jgi:ATP adenylyltransferase/5',5'''-P-1,P-4-tetraphosphate phosphorylase II